MLGAIPGEGFVPVPPAGREALRERSSATLAAAGLAAGQRALLSLNGDGDLTGPLLAEALVSLGVSAAVVGPRGRMRLLAAIRALRPDVWITTPTGALDFLARLYLEFNVDPTELELRHVLLVGEIETPGTARRLADELEARVTSLYCDPVFGAALAWGGDGQWQVGDPTSLGLAPLERDEWLAVAPGAADAPLSELVLRPEWGGALAGVTLRTGQVVRGASDASLFRHTVGPHVLVRGRWLALPLLRRALGRIDGIAGLRILLSRGERTLDELRLRLAFERASLVENPIWTRRIREAVAAITPIAFELETEAASEGDVTEEIVDERGHHLGLDRAEAARAAGG
jgi:phenylacetate-CoA ligase